MTAVDPRVERTREVVLAAAADLLAEEGFERATIDGIAERSRVARSTIYRNWPDRGELFADAFQQVCTVHEIDDHGSLADDFRALGQALRCGLTEDAWGRMIPSLVGAAEHDDELADAHRTFSARRRQEAVALVDRAKARGEVADHVDAEPAVERFAAGFFFRRLFVRQPIDDAFIDRQVEALVRDLTA